MWRYRYSNYPDDVGLWSYNNLALMWLAGVWMEQMGWRPMFWLTLNSINCMVLCMAQSLITSWNDKQPRLYNNNDFIINHPQLCHTVGELSSSAGIITPWCPFFCIEMMCLQYSMCEVTVQLLLISREDHYAREWDKHTIWKLLGRVCVCVHVLCVCTCTCCIRSGYRELPGKCLSSNLSLLCHSCLLAFCFC